MAVEAAADPLARGEEAIGAGDWEGARAAFEAALAEAPSAEAEEGLGRALWWLRADGFVLSIDITTD